MCDAGDRAKNVAGACQGGRAQQGRGKIPKKPPSMASNKQVLENFEGVHCENGLTAQLARRWVGEDGIGAAQGGRAGRCSYKGIRGETVQWGRVTQQVRRPIVLQAMQGGVAREGLATVAPWGPRA